MLRQLLRILLLSMHLEVHDISSVFCHLFIVTDINLLRTLRYEPHVMRNHQHTTLELIQTSGKRINRFHIQLQSTKREIQYVIGMWK